MIVTTENRVQKKFNLWPAEAEIVREQAYIRRKDEQDIVGEAIRALTTEKSGYTPTEIALIELFRKDSAEGIYNIEPWNMLLGRLGLPRLTYAEPPRKRR